MVQEKYIPPADWNSGSIYSLQLDCGKRGQYTVQICDGFKTRKEVADMAINVGAKVQLTGDWDCYKNHTPGDTMRTTSDDIRVLDSPKPEK